MKAGWYEKNGAAREVITVGEMPTPEPGNGEVRVRLHASGVNPSDVKSRAGRPLIAPRIVPHSDGAGVIDAVGPGVDATRVGERVWVWNGQWKRPFGTAAESIVLAAGQAVRLPDGIGFEEGACFGIPLLTAVEAVSRAGDLSGKTVLVTGAASGVGHYIVQIAALSGANVLGTASATRAEHARSAGATVIDYKSEDVVERVRELTGGRGADVVIDMDFASTAGMVGKGLLAQHGTLVCYGSNAMGDNAISFRDFLYGCFTVKFFVIYELTAEERAAALAEVERLLALGTLRHEIGARFPLDRLVDAHEAVEGGKVIGNVVVTTA